MTKQRTGTTTVNAIAARAGLNNLVAGTAAASLCYLFFDKDVALGFAAGLLVGLLNLYLLTRSTLKGISLAPEAARLFFVKRYISRFIMTVAALVVLLVKTPVTPLPLMGGFTFTLFVAITTLFFMAHRDIAPVQGPAGEAH